MHIFKRFASHRPEQVSLLLGLVAVGVVLSTAKYKSWDWVISNDVISYYAYLPAAFIYQDLSLGFTEDPSETRRFNIKGKPGPLGNKVIKTSMGVAMVHVPSFITGHTLAWLVDADSGGYSWPYRLTISLWGCVLLFLGLWFTARVLRQLEFSSPTSSLVLIALTFGTNLLWYATLEPGMPHVAGFALAAVFIFLTQQWYQGASYRTSLVLGLVSGLLSLARPTDTLYGLVFILWGVGFKWAALKQRLESLWDRRLELVVLVAAAFLVWLPQLLYWKAYAGSFFYFSYGDERFFWDNPHIFEVLFSFRNGLFVYSPILVFATSGLFAFKAAAHRHRLMALCFLSLTVYVASCWWCWWYGGSLGARTFISSFPIFALGLASAFRFVGLLSSRTARGLVVGLLSCVVLLGASHAVRYPSGTVHWDAMTAEAYFEGLKYSRPTQRYASLLVHPDYQKARRGIDQDFPPHVDPDPAVDALDPQQFGLTLSGLTGVEFSQSHLWRWGFGDESCVGRSDRVPEATILHYRFVSPIKSQTVTVRIGERTLALHDRFEGEPGAEGRLALTRAELEDHPVCFSFSHRSAGENDFTPGDDRELTVRFDELKFVEAPL